MKQGGNIKEIIILLFVYLFLLYRPLILCAEIYYHVDQNGIWHFTNIKTDSCYKLYLRTMNKKADEYINDYEDIILRASKRFGIEPALIKAIIKSESNFDHRAISTDGAKGLMQLMPDTAVEMEVINPLDPEENIYGSGNQIKDGFRFSESNFRSIYYYCLS